MGRSKRKSKLKQSVCSICQISCSSLTFSIPRCSSCFVSSRHIICDSCFYRHIFTAISQDITSRVICPEQGCDAELPKNIIRAALSAFGNQGLWDDYGLRSGWRGTNEQWIKRFAGRCPGCRVPIEKNGGCDNMVCKCCYLHFKWPEAKNFYLNPFGENPFGGGFPPQFPNSFPSQGFGQFPSTGGFFHGGAPMQGGNIFPSGSIFPPTSPRFSPPPISGQFGQTFGFPPASGGFGFSPPQYNPLFPSGQQPPYTPSYPPGQPFFPGNPNYFGSGSYGRPRSRRSSCHRSSSRRRRNSSTTSSSDDYRRRGSPFRGRGNPYINVPSFSNMPPLSPRGGSPVIFPQRPVW